MAVLLAQRCLHHPVREAVARCPECGQFYCRECITEHEDRVVCSSCLKRLTAKTEKPRRSFGLVWRVTAAIAGFVIAWMFFFLVGRLLVNIPSSFHEGTIFKLDESEAER
jgi:uncharacterized paraquat-inducible protein A